jgi:sialic acid synthase SpsE
VNIAGIVIGSGHPCRTICEISNNHNGKYENAVKLLNLAKAAGATFGKLQAYTPDELVALRGDGPAPAQWGEQGWTMRDLYTKAMTPREWFPDLFAHADRIGLPLFASVFGPESLAMLERLGCPAYKIASLDRDAVHLVSLLGATRKPILQSLPDNDPPRDSPWDKIGDVIDLAGHPNGVWIPFRNIAELYCPPGYPQGNLGLGNIRGDTVEGGKLGYEGFSYHGTDPMVPVYAVVAGAHVVECHLQLDDEPSELEANISLTGMQFAHMVKEIRKVEAML